jgi:hypothetical protein
VCTAAFGNHLCGWCPCLLQKYTPEQVDEFVAEAAAAKQAEAASKKAEAASKKAEAAAKKAEAEAKKAEAAAKKALDDRITQVWEMK